MNLHAFSTLRGCRLGRAPYVLSVVLATLLFYLSANWNVAFAQIAPPPPPASNETVTTPEDTMVTITTDAVVPAGNWYYVVVTNSPAHGTALGDFPVIGSNYKLLYTPGSNQTSSVSFAYQICTLPFYILFGQPPVCGTQATITVNITPVNDPPLALMDRVSTFKNVAKDIDVLVNDAGGPLLPNGTKTEPSDTVTLVSVATPTNRDGTATIVGNKIRYTPKLDFCDNDPNTNPDDFFTYTVRDSAGLLATGTVEVTVECGNAIITVGEPYLIDDHTFFVDLYLESYGVDVAAVDFFVVYADSNVDTDPACLVDPDGVTPPVLANNVTNMPLAVNGFFSQVTDVSTWNSNINIDADPDVDALRFSIAGIGNPNNTPPVPPTILTGPSINLAARKLATIKFKVNPAGCNLNVTPPTVPTVRLTLAQLTNGNGNERGFTGPDGQNVTGTVQNKDLSLANINQAPTDILLSNNVVKEGISNAFIGFLSSVDADAGDTATYTIVGDPTNYFYVRFGNELAVRPFWAGSPPPSGQYAVLIKSTDSFGAASPEKILTIFVTNVNRPPVAENDGVTPLDPLNLPPDTIIANGRKTIVYNPTLSANDTDPDDPGCTRCSIQSVTNGKYGTATTDGVHIFYTPTDPTRINATDIFTYTVTDNDPTGALTDQATVTVWIAAETYNNTPVSRGDCNLDGVIGAGDLVATAREIFDDPAGKNWYDIPLGNYAFSAYGCNSNLDAVIDVADLSCTAQKIFNNAYICPLPGLAAAGSMVNASLVVDSGLRAAPGTKVQVPVRLATGGNAVAAAAFAVNFDAATLSFDATDSDGDGLPDAVSLNAPGNTFTMANYNAEASRVEIVIAGLSEPMPLLADGAIATVTLTVKEEASVSESAVTLTESSLSDAQSLAVPVDVSGGSIQIGQAAYRLLLPVITKQ